MSRGSCGNVAHKCECECVCLTRYEELETKEREKETIITIKLKKEKNLPHEVLTVIFDYKMIVYTLCDRDSNSILCEEIM